MTSPSFDEMIGLAKPKVEPQDTSAQAKAAVKVFRQLQPTLNAYARAMTGRSDLTIVMDAKSNGATDGKKIFYRPPFELGAATVHNRRDCGKRTGEGLMKCPACGAREETLVTIYHEIAHIAFDSFIKTDLESARQVALDATAAHPGHFSKKIEQRINTAPAYMTESYIALCNAVSPYMPILYNAVEDARVNAEMFKVRPGTRNMFAASDTRIFLHGFEVHDGTIVKWNTAPLNSQVLVGLYAKSAGYTYRPYFRTEVVEALDDSVIEDLLDQLPNLKDTAELYKLCYPLFVRLRELGFLRDKDDPEEPESDDTGDDSASSSSDTDSEGGDGDGGSSSSGPSEPDGSPSEGRTPESSQASSAGSSRDDLPEDQDAENDMDASDSGSGSDSEASDGDKDDSGSGSQDGDGSEVAEDSTSDGSSDVGSAGSDSDESGDMGAGVDDASSGGKDSQEEGSGDKSSNPESSGSAPGTMDPSGLEGKSGVDKSDSGASEDGLSTDKPDGTGVSSGDQDNNSDSSDRPSQDASGNESGGNEPIETGSFDDDDGCRVIDSDSGESDVGPPPPMGTPEEVKVSVLKFGDHEDKPKTIAQERHEAAIEKALHVAIMQGLYFETESRTILGVREHVYGSPIVEGGHNFSSGWDEHSYMSSMYGIRSGRDADTKIPEGILGPALLRMRVAFSDNERGSHLQHLKSGRVNGRVLGKRAHLGDPRLFRKKIMPGKKSYFVIIGMDISGSTIGTNIVLEKRAVMAQSELCARMGIPFAIYAHTGNYASIGSSYRELMLDVYLIKEPDEPWNNSTKERLTKLGPDAANLDGHFLEYLRKVADKRPETDKIIMYYSDGAMPAENHDEELEILRREITVCKRKKYTLLGVGIRTDSPRRHGLDTVQVDSEVDTAKVVRHLEKRLLEVAAG